MARTKKQKINEITEDIIETEDPQANEVQATINSTSKASIGYMGTIQVIVKKNKQVIYKQNYTNHGTNYLFRFLSSCLTSTSPLELQQMKPGYVRLFSIDNTSYSGESFITEDHSTAISAAFPVVESSVDNLNRVHLKFTIPGTSVTGSNIYQIGLYSQEKCHDTETELWQYSAAFNFKEGNNWAPVVITAQSADYVLAIDWIMSFDNK